MTDEATNAAPSKQAAAREAKAAGLKTFSAHCATHGPSDHYVSNTRCLACKAPRDAEKYAKRVSTPEGREAHNTHTREYQQTLYKTSANQRGQQREGTAAAHYRKRTNGSMPASYANEREALQRRYGECPKGHQVDHLVAKVAKDLRGTEVASGLHNLANTKVVPSALNRMKASYHDPDNFREQRPANAFPGGAWDPELTEQEWSRVELLVRRYGADREATVLEMQAQIAPAGAGLASRSESLVG